MAACGPSNGCGRHRDRARVRLRARLPSGRGDDETYASSVAVNIGTTLLLAAALVLFERALVFTAQRAVQRATAPIRAEAAAARVESQFVRAENAQLTERTAVLESRLLDLDDQLRARADAATQEQARSFASLGETVGRGRSSTSWTGRAESMRSTSTSKPVAAEGSPFPRAPGLTLPESRSSMRASMRTTGTGPTFQRSP